MSKKTRYKIIFAFIIVLVLIIFELVSNYMLYKKYHVISLENASCHIPIRMWEPDSDRIYIADHMFNIEDNDGNYFIYGSQLEKYDNEDKQVGIWNVENDDFTDFDSIDKLQNMIEESTCLLKSVTDTHEYSRSIFNTYSITGVADGKYDGYNSFISVLKQNDMCFIEVIVYRDPECLSVKEMEHIMLNINWHQNNL